MFGENYDDGSQKWLIDMAITGSSRLADPGHLLVALKRMKCEIHMFGTTAELGDGCVQAMFKRRLYPETSLRGVHEGRVLPYLVQHHHCESKTSVCVPAFDVAVPPIFRYITSMTPGKRPCEDTDDATLSISKRKGNPLRDSI